MADEEIFKFSQLIYNTVSTHKEARKTRYKSYVASAIFIVFQGMSRGFFTHSLKHYLSKGGCRE